jgi:predicted  nucleic acid-binding Zn-ribbon protein
MAIDKTQSHEIDLDRTDRLPILEGVTLDDDVADDSVRLDYEALGQTAGMSAVPLSASHPPATDFTRPGVDLPSLAESVRSVEERIARQSADYEALSRLYEKARDAQLAAGTRADALAMELSTAHSALAVEQHRAREMERALSEGAAAAAASRARAEESSMEAERYHGEARTLRDALVARDATIAQVMHSLGERDTQLSALQREHAQTVPVLEARSRASARLEADLLAARTNVESLSQELDKSRGAVASLTQRLSRGESDLAEGRRDLSAAKAQAASYLELLSTRDWRGGFNQNLFREWDAKEDAARSGHGALQAECDRLSQSVALLTSKLAEQEGMISNLHSGSAADTAALAKKTLELEEAQRARNELQSRIERVEGEHKQMQAELETRVDQLAAARNAHAAELAAVRNANVAELAAVRDASVAELAAARNASAAELQRAGDSQAAAEARLAELSAQLDELRAEAVTHEEEMTVLVAHLNEARRPIQSIQADIKRLNDEVALKSVSIDQLTEENRTLRANLERTRGALEERDLLIRRLERNANNNANVLGRLQTSIERLGGAATPPLAGEFLAELIKIDGDTRTAYPLGRRTRIGRAPGCELQIDAQSVSRHHAMLLKGTSEIIIEDLNSTNGVLVNARKVTRQVLNDGDLITIGETHFQCRLRPHLRGSALPHEPTAISANAPAAVGPVMEVSNAAGAAAGVTPPIGPAASVTPSAEPAAGEVKPPHPQVGD